MSISRRNVLTFLGLAAPASAAISTDDMFDTTGPKVGRGFSDKLCAKALRRLAEGIERGEVNVYALDLDSSINPNEIVTQNLQIKFDLVS